jgi:hypothetical protein
MMVAHILVQTDVGVFGDVVGEIASIKGEVAVEAVTGPHDVIAKAGATSLDELGRLVIQRIQFSPGASVKR